MKRIDWLPVQLVLAALIAFKAFDDFFATVLTAAYRLNAFGLAEALGRLTPGDDFRRLVPLMEAVPLWLHGLWLLAGGLYLAAVGGLFSLKKWAPLAIVAAAASEVAAEFAGRPIIAAVGVVVNPDPSVFAVLFLPYVLPLLLAAGVWWVVHRPLPTPALPG